MSNQLTLLEEKLRSLNESRNILEKASLDTRAVDAQIAECSNMIDVENALIIAGQAQAENNILASETKNNLIRNLGAEFTTHVMTSTICVSCSGNINCCTGCKYEYYKNAGLSNEQIKAILES